jgi:uncharacterized protein (DUF1800 family)
MLKSTASIAAQRFGLGARPGELGRIGDARDWLEHQVRVPYRAPPELASLADSATISAAYLKAVKERREAKKNDGDPVKQVVNLIREEIVPHYLAQVEARTRIAATTDAPFRERLVYFWTNHFAVSVDKPVVSGIAGALENEAIRPHVTGRFVDLLLAVEQHPAMIMYLDNEFSIGPNSRLAEFVKRRGRADGRKIDINENLGREILELHTLGVDGGYTQADVTSFAKVLTGWSVGGGRGRLAAGRPGAFYFRENAHEPGAHRVLDKNYRESGISQGEAVLRDLARHPSTAKHLATKLARHFIADDPAPGSIERIAKAYRSSEGDLTKVYAAVIAEDAAWTPAPVKYKTPYEFVVSALRSMAIDPPDGKKLAASLEVLGQRTYSPGSPAGWPDTTRDWDGADALMKRVEWSLAFAERTASLRDARQVAGDVFGDAVSPATLRAIGRADSNAQALALLLMSPEFQRR